MNEQEEESLETLFSDIAAQVNTYRIQHSLIQIGRLIDSATYCISKLDFYGAARIYEDILDLYQDLSPTEKQKLYSRCSHIHEAILINQQSEQIPAVDNLIREYLALHKIGDWKNCQQVYLQIMAHITFLPGEKKKLVSQRLLATPLPEQIITEAYH